MHATTPLSLLLNRSGFTQEQLAHTVTKADAFYHRFHEMMATTSTALPVFTPGKAEQKFIRQNGGIAEAVIAKLGANSIAKRKPSSETLPHFVAYVRHQHETQQPLLFRLGMGPVKNVRHYGDQQRPDLAEYLMLVNLARIVGAIATLYPHGVKVELLPDDQRGGEANLWPPEYSRNYIAGVGQLITAMGFNWIHLEDGQERLYEKYGVRNFMAAADELLRRQQQTDPQTYASRLHNAAERARDNLVGPSVTDHVSDAEALDSARRYIVMLEAERMSKLFAPVDAFPLRFGHHPNSFQIFTMGEGLTKLPWQIALPPSLLSAEIGAPTLAALRPTPAPSPRLAARSLVAA